MFEILKCLSGLLQQHPYRSADTNLNKMTQKEI